MMRCFVVILALLLLCVCHAAIPFEPLPYLPTDLEPHVSATTLELHHGKHQATYVKKLNALLPNSGHSDESLVDIIRHSHQDEPMFNNAAQIWNHNFYFKSMVRHVVFVVG